MAVKKHVIKYSEKVYVRSLKNQFCSIKILVKHQINLKLDISMQTVCLLMIFSTLYTTYLKFWFKVILLILL